MGLLKGWCVTAVKEPLIKSYFVIARGVALWQSAFEAAYVMRLLRNAPNEVVAPKLSQRSCPNEVVAMTG